MNCPRCNSPLDDNAKFCVACGQKIEESTFIGAPKTPLEEPLRSTNPALHIIKKLGSSPLYLALCILSVVSVVFTAIYALFSVSLGVDTVFDLLNESGLADYGNQFGPILHSVGYAYTAALLVGLIPAVLHCIALWLTYASAKNNQSGGLQTTGLSIHIVILTIGTVLLALIALLVVACIGLVVFLCFTLGEMEMETILFVVFVSAVLVFLLATYAFAILYTIFLLRSLHKVKQTALTGVPSDKISRFAAIVLIVLGAFSAVSAVSSMDILLFVSSGVGAAMYIIGGILMLKYKDEMKKLSVQQTVETSTAAAGPEAL